MLLLERPGELVTREELRNKLWDGDVFVDFDRGVNKAINGLRRALNDRAQKPRFIETLPRRGYRFIAPVENGAAPITDGAGAGSSLAVAGGQGIDSLAVLPLENLSGDPAEEYFSDGMTAELISALAGISSLRVISRASVMIYKGARRPLPSIARRLRVRAIVDGTVARLGDKVRITTDLILASEDRLLWSGRYEREMCDVLKLQAEVAQQITSQIRALVDGRHKRPPQSREVHPPAYEAWLRGRFFRDKLTAESIQKSIGFFHQAIELDPTYAPAYGDLAQAYFYCVIYALGNSAEMFSRARAAAARALELDETIVNAHNALAVIHVFHDWDWSRAEMECRRAVALCPGDSRGHAQLADILSIQGRHREALSEITRALETDPISCVFLGRSGLILYRARRYGEAIGQCRKALEIDPNYANALWFMAWSLEQLDKLNEVIATLEQAVAISGASHYLALLARGYALIGQRRRALDILAELTASATERYVSPLDLAIVHAALGDLAAAFGHLEEAYRQKVWRIVELTLPMFDHLRCDPRWENLVRKIGLPL